jgi:monovalent cation/hydrogen antiporter
LVFLVFLPPLLYSAAWTLSWREFQRNFVSIAMLAVGLVLFTVLGLAMAGSSLLPGFDWESGVLLGAVVAATDAIAATSIARRVGLPQRIVDILETESLVNDGTGLVALQFGLIMLVTGRTPSVVEGVGRLMFLTCGGVLIGLAIGSVVALFERWVDDGPIEIVISILMPYAAYLIGDRVYVSGVIAVIACSMYMRRKSPEYMSPQVRLQATAVWDALTFVLNGIVFVLIGLQLPYVMGQIGSVNRMVLLRYGVGFSGVTIAVRMAWVYRETYRDLYCIRCPAFGSKGGGGEARSTNGVCDRVGWYARSIVAGGGYLVAVCPSGWKNVPAEEHDYIPCVLLDCSDAGGAGSDAAMADSKAWTVRLRPRER